MLTSKPAYWLGPKPSRQRTFTVALVGPDGAGKTTIGRSLEQATALRVKYVYLGINPEASNVMLPTTRLWYALKRTRGAGLGMGGPRDPQEIKPPPKNMARRMAKELKSGLRMVNQLAEEWFRQGVIWLYQRRGFIVLVDRHFLFDYYFHDIERSRQGQMLSNRLHGFILKRYYPKPDLVIGLDAPAEVLWARKPEGTIEVIEHRRQEYLRLRNLVSNFVTVDVTQPQQQVFSEIAELIRKFAGESR